MRKKPAEPPAAAERLRRYDAKRDFDATPEPPPGKRPRARPKSEPRFVIHEHHARRLHWDLRLEHDGALASWAIPKGLPEAPKDNRFAAATEDHPLEYLDFEAEIPSGEYGAGQIRIWDRGTYECLKWEPRKVEVALHGERVSGRYALFAIDKDDPPKDWMVHRMDAAADAAAEPMPTGLVPMLARAGALPRDEDAYGFEVKWDGVRALAYSTPGELSLQSRTGKDISDRYPELARLNRALSSHSAILDGEIVAFGPDGRPSFEALQRRMNLGSRAQAMRHVSTTPVTYVIFDLLWLDGHSVMGEPYAHRRELLAALALNGERWQTPDHVVGEGRALLEASERQGLEGVVAKRLDSVYEPGLRSARWIKVKTHLRQEFVVGGSSPGRGTRGGRIGALLLGVHDDSGKLRYAGSVGSGLGEGEIERLAALLAPLERASSPFEGGAKPPRGAVFCEPRLVVEVQFGEWTRAGSLRHPVYLGLRDDKAAADVVREGAREDDNGGLVLERPQAGRVRAIVGARELQLSNLDKVLYPHAGFTKGQLIDYYAAIAPTLLPHVSRRALTVTRWPDGVQGKSFFQKQAPAHRPPWVATTPVPTASKTIDYVLADDLPTLVWLANLAAIELHTPLAHADAPERPTMVVFDLDPGPPAGLLECCEVALLLSGMFENLGLRTVVKTSGSKGLQVYLPLGDGSPDHAATKAFARTVAELLEGAQPQLVVSRMTRARRTGRVLIDWSQNDARKTTVCAYSLRAGERPTASTPLDWDEVRAAHADRDASALSFEAGEVLERVRDLGDLFAPALSLRQALPSV